MTAIDYKIIGEAVAYYESCGYAYIDVPWVVSEKAVKSTIPSFCRATYLAMGEDNLGYFVGSAEQSFIHMMGVENWLPKGKRVAVSPCFRDEVSYNDATRLMFMKVELINYLGDEKPDQKTLLKLVTDVVADADNFIAKRVRHPFVMRTGDLSFDIVSPDGLELGSYGFREEDGKCWIYGTGLAEPRFSIARNEK